MGQQAFRRTGARGGLGALAVVALLAGCRSIPSDPTPSRQGELVVDVHTHAFTALHLPISGFVASQAGLDRPLGRLVERLALLQSPEGCEVPEGSPGELPDEGTCTGWLELARAASPRAGSGADDLSGAAEDQLGDEGFDRVWRCRLELANRRLESEEQTVLTDEELDEILDYALGRLASAPASLARLPLDLGSAVTDPLEVRAQLQRYVRLVWTLTRSADTVAECLVNTYPATDLFIPQMMDMQRWFPADDDVCRPIEIQIDDMRRVMEEQLGRVHAFLPYDPRRDLERRGQAFSLVRQNIDKGFLGVKVYPPMGFRASGNGQAVEGEGSDPPGATRYDEVLDAFFTYCELEQLPITAHCNPSGAESEPGRGLRSNPAYWRPVLEAHPQLRLNLGHFGGHDLGDPDGWSEAIGQLMDDFPHVYADVSYTDLPLGESFPREWQAFLERHPAAGQRLMFGSDWPMILRESYGTGFLAGYRAPFQESFPELVDGFFGGNALAFLGLTSETRNRSRLERFYESRDEGFRPGRWWPFVAGDEDD